MEYTNSEARNVIAEYIHNQRDRDMLYRRLIDGVTIERLAEEFDLSVSQTKRILKQQGSIVHTHFTI